MERVITPQRCFEQPSINLHQYSPASTSPSSTLPSNHLSYYKAFQPPTLPVVTWFLFVPRQPLGICHLLSAIISLWRYNVLLTITGRRFFLITVPALSYHSHCPEISANQLAR